MGIRNKREVFGKVIAYQYKGRLYKSKEKFLDELVRGMYFSLQHKTGSAHCEEEGVSWYKTRRAKSMDERHSHLLDKIRRRIEAIL